MSKRQGAGGARRRRRNAAAGLTAVAMAWAAAPAAGGPLELRQGSEVGAGTGFVRGDQCHVLTAAHVVPDDAGEVVVLDRSGARAIGQVSYSNPVYDVALVTLQPGFAVACKERWPDGAWMAAATWRPGTELAAVRHTPNGRETVILLRWAGGTQDTLTLARTDNMEIRSADSGSAVMRGEQLAGIITKVDTAVDRVEVLRFDLIDRLLGERFRGTGGGAVVFDGVFNRGRRHEVWSNYITAWLTEDQQRAIVAAGSPDARCRIRGEVLDWSQRNVPNPRHADLQQTLAGCKGNLLVRNSKTLVQMCENNARGELKSTPRHLRVHAVQLKVEVTPTRGATQSRLSTVELTEPAGAAASRADMALQTLQSAFGQVAGEMLDAGACP
ncbi:MAG: serine protease [Burkholderiales bacterium]|nr:serine protease [Burkholderiales bacterium]